MSATFDQKRNQVIISKHCLEKFKHNSKDPGWKEIWLNIEVIDAVNCYFEKKNKSYYMEGMKSLSVVGRQMQAEQSCVLSLREIILKSKNHFAL